MNYEDEEYVRYYTRETVGWKALGWEGQAVLALMLHGKFDRSGVFDCDGHDPSHAVTLVTGAPIEVTAVGLKRLTDCGAWVIVGGRIVWPKYVHAQSCRRTDKARQRESRDKRRVDALNPTVTNSDDPSHAVTGGHKLSLLAEAEQSRAEKPLKPPRVARRKRSQLSETPIPVPFVPTESHRTFCAKYNLNLALEVISLEGWADGKTAKSWNGTFTTRLVNAVKWRKDNGAQQMLTSVASQSTAEERKASASAAEQRAEAQRLARVAASTRPAYTDRASGVFPTASGLATGHPDATAGHS